MDRLVIITTFLIRFHFLRRPLALWIGNGGELLEAHYLKFNFSQVGRLKNRLIVIFAAIRIASISTLNQRSSSRKNHFLSVYPAFKVRMDTTVSLSPLFFKRASPGCSIHIFFMSYHLLADILCKVFLVYTPKGKRETNK